MAAASLLPLFCGGGLALAQDALQYGGRSYDPRDPGQQLMELHLAGDAVTGHLSNPGTCDPAAGLYFPSADLDLEGLLRGPWEGQGSLIHGSWTGPVEGCAIPPEPPPRIEAGSFCLFMAPGPDGALSVLARLAAGGEHRDYVHAPLGRVFGTGVAPANIGQPEVRLTYPDGRAWTYGIGDGRTQRLELAVAGSRVHGSFHTPPVCGSNVSLAGGDMVFEGTLDGPWEAPGTTITGVWGGSDRFCDGTVRPDFGSLRISMGPTPGGDPGILVQLAGLRGLPYAYYHRPLGQAGANPGGSPATADPLFALAAIDCALPDVGAAPPPPQLVEDPPPDDGSTTGAGGGGAAVGTSVALLLDASGSMQEDGRMDAAKAAARRVVGQMDGSVEVALIVFYDCGDVRVAAGFTTEPAPILAALEPVQPTGGTPLAEGIGFAKEHLRSEGKGATRRLVVLTDGNESCSGDLMGAVSE